MTDEAKATAEKWVLRVGALAGALAAIGLVLAYSGGKARDVAKDWVVAEAQAQGKVPVAEVKAELEEHKADDAAFKRQVLERFSQQDATTYALYRAVLTGQRQPKLEALGDGGP